MYASDTLLPRRILAKVRKSSYHQMSKLNRKNLQGVKLPPWLSGVSKFQFIGKFSGIQK